MLHLDKKVKEQKKQLLELEAELTASRGEVVRLIPQLVSTRNVRDRGVGYEYGAGVAHLRAHLLAHPRTKLKRLDLEALKPDDATC